jgi:5-formyltetrahydrofolate cyclo-ligase
MTGPTKASLRAEARKILDAISPRARAAASVGICGRIRALPEWAAAPVVALYAAQPSEPDLAALLSTPGKEFCFPRIAGDTLEFRRCNAVADLVPGPWNLLEPDPSKCPIVPPSEIALFAIPGLAFTRAGARLGRGGGFYDRFLGGAHPNAAKLGICFHAQLVPTLPVESHDHEVTLIITESESIPAAMGR